MSSLWPLNVENLVLLRRVLFVLNREDEMQVGLTSEDKRQLQGVSLEQLLTAIKAESSKFSRGSSAYRGVSYSKQNRKYCAQVRDQGKKIALGKFDIEEDAARAYDKAARRFHGRYSFAVAAAFLQHSTLHFVDRQRCEDASTLNCMCHGRRINLVPLGTKRSHTHLVSVHAPNLLCPA